MFGKKLRTRGGESQDLHQLTALVDLLNASEEFLWKFEIIRHVCVQLCFLLEGFVVLTFDSSDHTDRTHNKWKAQFDAITTKLPRKLHGFFGMPPSSS